MGIRGFEGEGADRPCHGRSDRISGIPKRFAGLPWSCVTP